MKNIIVTGASGNMGSAIVKKFLAEGHFVIGTMAPGDNLDIEDFRFEKKVVDLTNEEKSSEFIASTIARYQTIDAIILTVGGFATGNILDTRTTDISRQVKLNFDTAYNIIRPVFAQMIRQKHGRIFMTGSKPGLHSFHGKGMVAYSLAKSLLFRLADLLNDEAKGTDVVTSMIVPSIIDTPQNRQSMPTASFADWVTPEEIAGVIYYHCSDQSGAPREPVIKIYGHS